MNDFPLLDDRALADDRDKGRDTQLCALLEDPLKFLPLEDALIKGDLKLRLALEWIRLFDPALDLSFIDLGQNYLPGGP